MAGPSLPSAAASGPQLPNVAGAGFGGFGGGAAPTPPAAAPGGPQLGPGGGAGFGGFGGFGGGGGGGGAVVQQGNPDADRTEGVRVPGEKPRFLASETASRAMAPVEPWAGTLRLLMILMGAILVVTFVAPWRFGDGRSVFAWDVLDRMKGADKILPIVVVAGGLAALVGGVIGLGARVRGIIAGVVGGALLVLVLSTGFGKQIFVDGFFGDQVWRAYALTAAFLLGPAALLVRSKYPAAGVARVLAVIAVVFAVLPFVIPIHGKMPIKEMKEMTAASGNAKYVGYALYLLLAAGAAPLVALVPAQNKPAATALAWAGIAALPLFIIGFTIVAPLMVSQGGVTVGELLKRPGVTLFPALWALAATALAAYGQATVIGKRHERAG